MAEATSINVASAGTTGSIAVAFWQILPTGHQLANLAASKLLAEGVGVALAVDPCQSRVLLDVLR